jgi:hypothetical protein
MSVRSWSLTATSFALAATAAVCAPLAAAADEPVPSPTVTGPIPVTEDSYPFLSTDVVDAYGYVEEEFFLEGTARDYNGGQVQGTSPYRTRIVVRRPAAAQDASGPVVLEWNNVTGGFDQEFEWFTSHEYFMRSGITWVGVSNQSVGINDLRRWNPERYGSLVFEGDQYSEDVFSQAAQALLAPAEVDPLAGIRPSPLIAGGHSQSGTRLAGYYNEIHPLHGLVDGFMIRGIENEVHDEEVRVPVLRVQTETDFTEGSNASDEDSEFYRRWEVAGSSHVDWQQQQYRVPLIERDRGSATPLVCVEPPFSRIPFQHVLNAGYDAMVRWLETGTPPPTAPRFEADAFDRIQCDEHGNALGAIRLPEHEVPTATNTGDNVGAGFCILYGSHEPFDQETLAELYPTHEAYVAAFEAAAGAAVQGGFLLPVDAERSIAAARAADLGLPSGGSGETPPADPGAPANGSSEGGAPAGGTTPATEARALPATGPGQAPALAAVALLVSVAVARRLRLARG